MGGTGGLLVANVAEAGDIVLYALVLGITLAVGLVLLGIDAAVRRLRRRLSATGGGAHLLAPPDGDSPANWP